MITLLPPEAKKRTAIGASAETPVHVSTPRCDDCRFAVRSGSWWGCAAYVYPTWGEDDPLQEQHPTLEEARGDPILCGPSGKAFEAESDMARALREAEMVARENAGFGGEAFNGPGHTRLCTGAGGVVARRAGPTGGPRRRPRYASEPPRRPALG
jgi:hypothetical protein